MDVSAAFLADSSTGISQVKLRRQTLNKLAAYKEDFIKEQAIKNVLIDSLSIWQGKNTEKSKLPEISKSDPEQMKILDREQQLFMPRGAVRSSLYSPLFPSSVVGSC